jgi:hypothetical protein
VQRAVLRQHSAHPKHPLRSLRRSRIWRRLPLSVHPQINQTHFPHFSVRLAQFPSSVRLWHFFLVRMAFLCYPLSRCWISQFRQKSV